MSSQLHDLQLIQIKLQKNEKITCVAPFLRGEFLLLSHCHTSSLLGVSASGGGAWPLVSHTLRWQNIWPPTTSRSLVWPSSGGAAEVVTLVSHIRGCVLSTGRRQNEAQMGVWLVTQP